MTSSSSVERLISISGPQLGQDFDPGRFQLSGAGLEAAAGLFTGKNGFYAFESALHVFPFQSTEEHMGLDLWNSATCWRDAYGGITDGLQFFAEDVFGGQFCIKEREFFAFDPETGELSRMGESLDEWAQTLLEDYPYWTGHALAHEWQGMHGRLRPGSRLVPKVPFVVGGEYAVENLYAHESVKGMRYRGDLATQVRDLPDGAKIKFTVGLGPYRADGP